ncbi:hypothetical protein GCM10011403_16980 [Pseudohongiella nitratireducens]|uniref:Uncharacterized protein n=1 Tax=Pseudohongiella nitratireducens TaxID=1768907 RepID=A0A917LVJ1_9GAMM|nr:hypothetical protein GCM10011403_16980 [Pseudohongiella nitratireducens]
MPFGFEIETRKPSMKHFKKETSRRLERAPLASFVRHIFIPRYIKYTAPIIFTTVKAIMELAKIIPKLVAEITATSNIANAIPNIPESDLNNPL